MDFKKWILKLLPVILGILVLFILWACWKSELLSFVDYIKKVLVDFRDYGNILSLLSAIVILYLCDYHIMVIKNIQTATDSAWKLIFILLGFIGLVGVWFALRAVGFTILLFILVENQLYSVENIFNIVSFLLIANFCFTLLRTFKEIGTSEENNHSSAFGQQKPIVPKLLDITIQGLIITIISFAPRYAYEIEKGRFNEYVTLILLFIFSIIALLYVKKNLLSDRNMK